MACSVSACVDFLVIYAGVSFISPEDDDENSTDDGGGVGFWTTLFDAGVSHKALMAVIYYQLDQPRQVMSMHLSMFICFATKCH